jgi:hypothetical protein
MDCRLGKIEKFEENNNNIIEVFDESIIAKISSNPNILAFSSFS